MKKRIFRIRSQCIPTHLPEVKTSKMKKRMLHTESDERLLRVHLHRQMRRELAVG